MIRAWTAIIIVAAALPQAEAERWTGARPPLRKAHSRTSGSFQVRQEPSPCGVRATHRQRKRWLLRSLIPGRKFRSLAAQQLVAGWQIEVLDMVLQAWLSETDTCTKAVMKFAANELADYLASDISQLPGGQLLVKPFQACTQSGTPVIALRLDDVSSSWGRTMVLVSVRNLTPQPLAFVGTRSPEELFSVTVLDPAGAHAKIPESQQSLYDPPAARPGPRGGLVQRPNVTPADASGKVLLDLERQQRLRHVSPRHISRQHGRKNPVPQHHRLFQCRGRRR